MKTETPATTEAAAKALAAEAADGGTVRFRGGGTKWAWGRAVPDPTLVISTAALTGVREYDPGDLTAVVRAGTTLADLQSELAAQGQRLALDPPGAGATVGGVVATADSGPLRHRYGGGRDLILGITVALSDGMVAHAGGKVIKNVAGYDLAKLFTGSYGTLGLILDVAVRLHPLPAATATLVGASADPASLARAAAALAHAPVEAECLDAGWDGDAGHGAVLARFGGADARLRADRAQAVMAGAALDVTVVEGDDEETVWRLQRERQRASAERPLVVKVASVPGWLGQVLAAARAWRADVSARAALGLAWVRLPLADPFLRPEPTSGVEKERRNGLAALVEAARATLPGSVTVLDRPAGNDTVDPWGEPPSALSVMRRVKERFDPAGACAPGLYVGDL